ncbi:hypothetical protein REPUB_Repub15cG0097900 [Reevesia pubescens]
MNVNGPVLVEDTCLCFNALKGLPGSSLVFVLLCKWFLEKIGHEGLNNLLMAYEDKSAYALCAFSFALRPDFEPINFLGKTPLLDQPYATSSGGYKNRQKENALSCAVFTPSLSYAEMPKEEKNKISHQSRALDMVKSHFAEAGYSFSTSSKE